MRHVPHPTRQLQWSVACNINHSDATFMLIFAHAQAVQIPHCMFQAMRKSAQEATERNQQLEKDMHKQKQALDEQKRQVAEDETERKRLEGMVSTADDHLEELDRLRQAAEDHLAELDGLKVHIQ